MKENINEKINNYYNNSHFFYRFFWMNKRNLSMHYGFWDEGTKNLHEALLNENKYIADALDIKKSDTILDAGCGVGGTAIWIAEKYGAKVTGITITKRQISLADKYAKGREVEDLVNFQVKDFCKTGLPSESFEKIYAIESVCHAEDKRDFLKEAFRLLKKGGRLVVCDGFLSKDILNEKDQRYYQELCEGWVLPNLASHKTFKNDLKELGFQGIKFVEGTDKIMKSSQEMYKSARFIHPLVVFLEKLKLTQKTNVLAEIACKAQYHIFQDKMAVYGVFNAEK